jgi:hypothetical protein
MHNVRLYFAANHGCVGIRELCGYDEQSVIDINTFTAVALLDRLIEPLPGTVTEPVQAAKLPVPDRDHLLACLYMQSYGPRVDSTVDCVHCGGKFDLDFSVSDVMAGLYEKRPVPKTPESGGVYHLTDGTSFRLPTGEDELAVMGLSRQQAATTIMQRCILEGNCDDRMDAVESAMDSVAPQMNLDIDAVCPLCGQKQQFYFDIQPYLLMALMRERRRLYREIHLLAAGYHWRLDEILSLPRSQRRALVALLEEEGIRNE